MRWPVQDAKARFSELLDAAVEKGPQIVTRRGIETVVVVQIDDWKRLGERTKPTLVDVLLGPGPRWDDDFLEPRPKFKPRKPPKF